MNVWDVLVVLLLAVVVGFAFRAIKNGKTGGCSGNCSGCTMDCKKRKE
ncbi:MAG: FeoB-associated Cys-rich membrane protein [Clostridiales bacterium]|nr:FeoB-associated Cys-rich membrane protein [Candidatus Crickella merdequi]